MNVVRPEPGQHFVALSYMWQNMSSKHDIVQLQKANLHSLEAAYGLRNVSLPDIITDTIALCRALGERYLWVDRFCIVQDDEVSKLGQIGAMDAVYSSAKLTIMAALNKSTTSVGLSGCPRLPGCPGRPRLPSAMDPWARLQKEERRIHPGFDGSDDAVDISAWNHRAWTFQERFLSRCRLFITESQAIFQCNGGRYSAFEHLALSAQHCNEATENPEDEVSVGHPPTASLSLKSIKDGQGQVQRSIRFLGFNDVRLDIDSIALRGSDDTSFTTYRSCVYEYQQRQLSFRSDILNAFMGMGNVFARAWKTRMLFGLPERHLYSALRWNMPYEKNLADWEADYAPHYAPSWSWASTQCPKRWDYWSMLDTTLSLIQFYCYDLAPSDLAQPLRKLDTKDENGTRLPGLLKRSPLTESFYHISTDLAQPVCEAARRLSGSLIFNTATITCRLGPLDTLDTLGLDSGRLYSQALLTLPSNTSMGRADLDSKWTGGPMSRAGDEIKIVVIAVRHLWINAANSGQPKPEALDVLLVEPEPREPLAVRRIGLGFVTKLKLWHSCNPQWETVLLC